MGMVQVESVTCNTEKLITKTDGEKDGMTGGFYERRYVANK